MKPNQLAKHAFGLQTTGVGEALGCRLYENSQPLERDENMAEWLRLWTLIYWALNVIV